MIWRRPSIMGAVVGGVVSTLLVAGAFTALWYVNQREAARATGDDRRHSERLERLDDLQIGVSAELTLLAELDPANAADLSDRRFQVRATIFDGLSGLLASVQTGDQAEAAELREIEAGLQGFDAALSREWERAAVSGAPAALAGQGSASSQGAAVLQLIDSAIGDEREKMFQAKQTIARDQDRMRFALAFATAGAAVVILGLGAAGRYLIARPLQEVSSAAREMAAGPTSRKAPLPLLQELADVGAAVNALREGLTEQSAEIHAYLAKDLEHKTEELERANAELVRANAELESEIEERLKAEDALRRSEEALRQSQKMESIGRLAGGVAHDFNNLLSAIIGYAELASLDVDPQSQAHADIEESLHAARRAADLTRQLLAFARRQIVETRVVVVDDLVADMEKLLRRLIGEDVELVFQRQAGAAAVKVDPGQFEQVVVNLAVNARDAMPGGGVLTIETDAVSAAADGFRGDLPPGNYVVVSVTDTGTGMTDAVREHLFEPFFTTKERGKGTGLGLATSYGIVQQAGGQIHVSSVVGEGTIFTIYLPRSRDAAQQETTAPVSAVPARGTETILLVEDQAEVRELAQRVLSEHGYTVLAAATPHEGLRLAGLRRGHIDLVVTDVIMPEMNGVEMIEKLLAFTGDVPVLFMSGYAEQSIVDTALLREGTAFLAKPFTRSRLLAAARELLDRRGLAGSVRDWSGRRAVEPWEGVSAGGL